jgi:membrane protein implicated in regulation of membrane protease activity
MFLVLLAAVLLMVLVAIAFTAGIGIVAILAAILVGAALLAALTAIALILAARHAETLRRRSSRTHVLSDIRAVESRLIGNERGS